MTADGISIVDVGESLEEGRDLVRELAARVDAGGDAGDHAARALGMLVERETVERDPSSRDEMIAWLYGGDLSARRLSAVAVHEARAVVREHVRRMPVPGLGSINALIDDRDPDVVPVLISVVERTLDDPSAEPAAHQAVRGLAIHSDDPRAVAVLRVAAARGHGEARATAQSWLAVHGHRPPPAREARQPVDRRSFDCDVHMLQRRPCSRELVAAADGVLLRITLGGPPPARIQLSSKFPASEWWFRNDGAFVLATSASGVASLVALDGGDARDVTMPPFQRRDVRVRWTAARAIFSGDEREFWMLQGAEFERIATEDVVREEPSWCALLDALPRRSSRVLRDEPDESRVLAYADGQLVAVRDGERVAAASEYFPDVAFDGVRFYGRYDHEVVAIDATGDEVARFDAPAGFVLRALDVVGTQLAVVAAPLAGGSSELLVYDLPP